MVNLAAEYDRSSGDIRCLNYMEMFISDISSLYDFCWNDESKIEAKEKIKNIYGIDVDGLVIVDILEQIRKSKG